MILCKRAYSPVAPQDGKRILVDRLWPRNCSKGSLKLDDWLPDAAPSTDLRKAFKAGNLSFAQFKAAYRAELAGAPAHWWKLVELAQSGNLTLIFAARSIVENNAVVLAEWLEDELERHGAPSSAVCYVDPGSDR
jgi:uncharacterized protein YeaO (DUF488 family)